LRYTPRAFWWGPCPSAYTVFGLRFGHALGGSPLAAFLYGVIAPGVPFPVTGLTNIAPMTCSDVGASTFTSCGTIRCRDGRTGFAVRLFERARAESRGHIGR